MSDLNGVVGYARRWIELHRENKFQSEAAKIMQRVVDALVSVRAERDAALARIAELEAELEVAMRPHSECERSGAEAGERIVDLEGDLARAEARIAEAAKLHRKAHAVFSWATGGVRYEDPCPDCDGKAGVHDCGCWADVDIEYHCAECDGSRERASWPCPTAVALGLNEGGNDD